MSYRARKHASRCKRINNNNIIFFNHSAWLESEDGEVIAKVNRRIGAVTGLEMNTAEPLQVLNQFRY